MQNSTLIPRLRLAAALLLMIHGCAAVSVACRWVIFHIRRLARADNSVIFFSCRAADARTRSFEVMHAEMTAEMNETRNKISGCIHR